MWASPRGGSPGPQVALLIQTNMQCHYGGSCCSRPRGCSGGACAPHPYPTRRERGGPGTGAPREAAWGRCRVRSSCTSRMPCGTASTEPGRPLAFHYWAYESSSPGKYVAIKINRPALSAEHNANYLWAVCAIFIIVQAPGASCLRASPAHPGPRRAKLRAGCGGQRALGNGMGFRGPGHAPSCFPGREPHFGLSFIPHLLAYYVSK